MPLTFNNVDSHLGITLDNCYGLISRYEGDMTTLTIYVAIYANKQAYEQGRSSVSTERILIQVSELAKTNIFAYIYDALLSAQSLTKYELTVIEYPFSMVPTLTDPAVTPDPNDLSAGGSSPNSEES